MINLYKKLEREQLLKKEGKLLDLGSGNGKVSESFFSAGYEVTLVDKNAETLKEAEENFRKIRETGYKTVNSTIEDFSINESHDGIILSNVLPFVADKTKVQKIVRDAYAKVSEGGFLLITLFGVRDQWATERAETMSFYEKDEALQLLAANPYFISEDFGTGATMKGGMKTWHVFYLLYVKKS